MAEQVDARDLKSLPDFQGAGSIPASGSLKLNNIMKQMFYIFVVLLALSYVAAPGNTWADSKTQSSAQISAERFLKFLETGDTLNLQAVFSDSFLQAFSIQNLLEEREDALQNWGDLKSIENLKFTSKKAALAQISIGEKELELYFEFDENGKINDLELVEHSDEDLKPKVTWEELGKDTLLVFKIEELEQLRNAFQKDKGKVRLVSLLSPT